jgi:hypothetical protein
MLCPHHWELQFLLSRWYEMTLMSLTTFRSEYSIRILPLRRPAYPMRHVWSTIFAVYRGADARRSIPGFCSEASVPGASPTSCMSPSTTGSRPQTGACGPQGVFVLILWLYGFQSMTSYILHFRHLATLFDHRSKYSNGPVSSASTKRCR